MKRKSGLTIMLLLSVVFSLCFFRSAVYAETEEDHSRDKVETVREEIIFSKAEGTSEKESLGEIRVSTLGPGESDSGEIETGTRDSLKDLSETVVSETAESRDDLSSDASALEEVSTKENKAAGVEDKALNKTTSPIEIASEAAEKKVLNTPATTIKDIYLNGENGSDDNDGSSIEKALKTFQKVKELVTKHLNIENIYITGTTPVEGEVSLKDTRAKILREKGFNGYLLRVESNKKATLKDITVDGNSDENKNIEKALVDVQSGGILNITEGAVLKNNKIKAIKNTATRGGGVYAYRAEVNMSGGVVEGNQATYGGGIHLNQSTMNFTGGVVQGNRAELVEDMSTNPPQYYSAGGGILAGEGSTINMSGDAKVLNNFAAEIGGGISLGSNQWGKGNTLNMTGGTVDGNTAGAAGGGIFIQAKYFSGGPGVANISAGKITNNRMDGTGKTEKAFGGGGIYVNGAVNRAPFHGSNGILNLTNVLITDNTSKFEGAGMANCPISKTIIHINNGAALYGNRAERSGNDLFIYSSKYMGLHSGEAVYKLSKRMLGGAYFNWTTPDGKPLADELHEGTLSAGFLGLGKGLALNVGSEGNGLTKALAKVIISGNHSETRGGGIGSNGTIVIGTESKPTEVPVQKRWDDNDNKNNKRPKTIIVELYGKAAKGEKAYLVDKMILDETVNWKGIFKDLPTIGADAEIIYTVKEQGVDGYTSKITGNAKDGFTITNKEKPNIPPETPEVPPETPEVPPETPEVPPETPEVPPETPEVPPETPEVPPKTSEVPHKYLPKTGDGLNPSLFASGISLSGALLTILGIKKRKDDEEV